MTYIVNYVYSVINCPEEKSFGCTGLKGEEVLTIPVEDISAVVSRIQTNLLLGSTIIEPVEANWLKHDEVVRSLMPEYTVLPVKFGSVLKLDRDLNMMIRRILPECREEVKRFKDKVEVGVKILAGDEAIRREASKEHKTLDRFRNDLLHVRSLMLKGKKTSLGKAVEIQLDALKHSPDQTVSLAKVYYTEKFYSALLETAVEAKANSLLAPDMILNSSLLLRKNDVENLQTKVNDLKQTYPEFEFLPSGPWAPYNFTRIKYY